MIYPTLGQTCDLVGVAVNPSHDIYAGQFQNGRFSGTGKMVLPAC